MAAAPESFDWHGCRFNKVKAKGRWVGWRIKCPYCEPAQDRNGNPLPCTRSANMLFEEGEDSDAAEGTQTFQLASIRTLETLQTWVVAAPEFGADREAHMGAPREAVMRDQPLEQLGAIFALCCHAGAAASDRCAPAPADSPVYEATSPADSSSESDSD